jgi:hypothetical protein
VAGIGILVDDGSATGYAYKIKVPAGSITSSVLDLSNPSGGPTPSFMDGFYLASANADSQPITKDIAGNIVRKDIIENGVVVYTVAYAYDSGQLVGKTVSKTTGGSVEFQYVYVDGEYTNTLQIGGT